VNPAVLVHRHRTRGLYSELTEFNSRWTSEGEKLDAKRLVGNAASKDDRDSRPSVTGTKGATASGSAIDAIRFNCHDEGPIKAVAERTALLTDFIEEKVF
jgi:hypothetical protein